MSVSFFGIPIEGYLTNEFSQDAVVSEAGINHKLVVPQRVYGKQFAYETFNVLKYFEDSSLLRVKPFYFNEE